MIPCKGDTFSVFASILLHCKDKDEFSFNPFVPNAPFLYPYGFLMFSEGRERVHWEQMS